ncbi:MAG: endonuclease III domain-containing protein [Candidatus Coatesbacteria bacterium]|nr:MAG: endonuclease III domain-containing protein [Candidatus Coatesbacteria bacterium]
MNTAAELLREIYRRLEAAYGDQQWWPGETPFEIAVGAILTQNTAWGNVEKALARLREADRLTFERLAALPPETLAPLIKPAGYYNVKARRLAAFLDFLGAEYGGRVEALAEEGLSPAREKLLAVKGIGPETADSILLYACGLPTFVVDAYTYRVLFRHGLAEEAASYDELKELFEAHLPPEVALYNQYHALLVRVGRERCRRGEPRCAGCALEGLNR